MSLKEQLSEQFKKSMKEKDLITKSTVTMIRAAIKQVEVDNKVELDDDGVLDVIMKQVKQRKDALEEFTKAKREDLIEQTKGELKVLEAYLPKQLSKEELTEIVKKVFDEVKPESMKDMGKIMNKVMPLVKGKADGKAVNEVARELLNK